MSVIEDIYNGSIYPAEQIKPDSEAFLLHVQNEKELSRKLYDFLTEEQRGVLDEYQSETAIVADLYNLEYYRAGVKFGVELFLEALEGRGGLPKVHN